jgi:predicted DNA-binding transcriptional regulator AlpA
MMNRAEIAALLRVTTDTLRKRIEARPDFPRPALRLSRKTVLWDEAEIRRWMERERARA